MVKQREGHKVIFSDLANQRIKDNSCPTCGKSKTEWIRRKDWRCCSPECTDRFWKEQVIVSSWANLRMKCFLRDNFTCKCCNKKPIPKRKEFERIGDGWLTRHVNILNPTNGDYASLLIADHIKAIALGGEEWDINNLQTLCIECNKIKNRKDIVLIANLRVIEKKQRNQKLLIDVIK